MTLSLRIDEISPARHEEFLAEQPSASFLQNPSWPQVKTERRGQSLGWFSGDSLVATSLVLYRAVPVPGLRGRSLAYLADGPVFNPEAVPVAEVVSPLIPYLRSQGAFLIRMGLPFVTHRWGADSVRSSLAAGGYEVVTDLTPEATHPEAIGMTDYLRESGWQEPKVTEDFQAGQAQFQARIPLPQLSEADRADRNSEGFQAAVEEVLARMDSTSRRQTRKSTRSDLSITVGGPESLGRWQALYEETATRDGFTGRGQQYFEHMERALNGSEITELKVLFAEFQDQLLASAIYVQQADTGWYVYGASSREESKRYAPRALQLEQIMLSLEAGCTWYDLGGLSPTLNKEHALAGLSRFKTTMGADVVATVGEWDYPLTKVLAHAFTWYMKRREQ